MRAISWILILEFRNNQQAHPVALSIISSNQFQETTRRSLNIGGRVMRFPKPLLKENYVIQLMWVI
jgi:hypothetical protein